MDKQKVKEIVSSILDRYEHPYLMRLDGKTSRGKGPKFIVDSKGRVKKMYKKGGEVTKFKGHF
jgi:hypothetical protein|tara:strand:+ start:76 stop:264 length:189 start_codon:yes stop_codon:yes gene_type:complete